MLLRIYRNVVFIHDRYIFASNLLGSVYKDIPFMVMPKLDKKKTGIPSSIKALSYISDNPLEEGKKGFYEEVDVIDSVERELKEKLELLQPKNTYEYILRGLPRDKLLYLVKTGYAWIIPYKNIISLKTEMYKDTRVIRIEYNCPLTNTRRVFKMIYDPEIYDLLEKLYLSSR